MVMPWALSQRLWFTACFRLSRPVERGRSRGSLPSVAFWSMPVVCMASGREAGIRTSSADAAWMSLLSSSRELYGQVCRIEMPPHRRGATSVGAQAPAAGRGLARRPRRGCSASTAVARLTTGLGTALRQLLPKLAAGAPAGESLLRGRLVPACLPMSKALACASPWLIRHRQGSTQAPGPPHHQTSYWVKMAAKAACNK